MFDQGFEIVVPGPPMRKNERHRMLTINGRPAIVNSRRFKLFAAWVAKHWRALDLPKIDSGAWTICVVSHWPRLRHLDSSFPHGDVDATVSAALDALELCGAIDDDARFVASEERKEYDKDDPHTVITVRPA